MPLLLCLSWLPRRALPYCALVALIADLLSRACDDYGVDEQSTATPSTPAMFLVAMTLILDGWKEGPGICAIRLVDALMCMCMDGSEASSFKVER
jgi:hypothetical protein